VKTQARCWKKTSNRGEEKKTGKGGAKKTCMSAKNVRKVGARNNDKRE
jgi:hypothetical protein